MAQSSESLDSALPQGCRPLTAKELARLPDSLCEQTLAAPALCPRGWLVLSAEPVDAPAPQTHRLLSILLRLGHSAEVVLSSRLEVQGYLRLYRRANTAVQVRDGQSGLALSGSVDERATGGQYRETAASRLALDLVEYAVTSEASDIHLECRRDTGTRVRFRRYGRLLDGPMPLQNDLAEAVCHYLFSLGRRGNRHWQPTSSCDGVVDIQLAPNNPLVQLRLASLPEVRGWDLVVRLFNRDQAAPDLQSLGYSARQLDDLRAVCRRPYGAILFSGPTGSGKSTSMLAALAELPSWVKVISLEQPVERTLPNVSHITAANAEELPAQAPALNRCDADVAVLGELRDSASAAVLCDFTTSGKLTLATVHAARASSIPLRLLEMGVSPGLLGDSTFLLALINQRLLPRLCDHCRLSAQAHRQSLPSWWLQRHGSLLEQEEGVFMRGEGCDFCTSGVQGRQLAAEVVVLEATDYALLACSDWHAWHAALGAKDIVSLERTGLQAVLAGLVDPVDASMAVGLPTAPDISGVRGTQGAQCDGQKPAAASASRLPGLELASGQSDLANWPDLPDLPSLQGCA